MDNTCENGDHFWSWLWVGQVDHKRVIILSERTTEFLMKFWNHAVSLLFFLSIYKTRGIDVNERTVTRHSYSLLNGKRFGHYMSIFLLF